METEKGIEPVSDHVLAQVNIDRARKEGMIEALRWECEKCGGCTSYEENKDCRIPQAITRIQDGGEL